MGSVFRYFLFLVITICFPNEQTDIWWTVSVDWVKSGCSRVVWSPSLVRKSPPIPSISPGQQKRVRFLMDNNNDSSCKCWIRKTDKILLFTSLSALGDHQPSILFRQDSLTTQTGIPSAFDEMENSRRITSNFLFGNTTLPYDFGLVTQMGIDQPTENPDLANNNFTFVHANQRTKYTKV